MREHPSSAIVQFITSTMYVLARYRATTLNQLELSRVLNELMPTGISHESLNLHHSVNPQNSIQGYCDNELNLRVVKRA